MLGVILEIIGIAFSFQDKEKNGKTRQIMLICLLAVVTSILLSGFLILQIIQTKNYSLVAVSAAVSLLLTFITLKVFQKRQSFSGFGLKFTGWIIYAVFLIYLFAGFFVYDFYRFM